MKLKKAIKGPVPMLNGIEHHWGDIPMPFRIIVDKRRLGKLIRLADTLGVLSDNLGAVVVPQKGSLSNVVAESADVALFVCSFNGLDLVIYGIADLGSTDT